MSEQQPQTLTCPRCGNINAYKADKCLKCELSLGSIRKAMAGQAALADVEASSATAPAEPKEPAPPLPELARRPTTKKKPSHFVDSWGFLIRGMGDRADEIAAHFFKQLSERGIEALSLSIGSIAIDVGGGRRDSREYYFAERDLGRDAAATMAVRIAPTGKDLFVEWRHYTTPSLGAFDSKKFRNVTAVAAGISLVIAAAIATIPGGEEVTPIFCWVGLIIGMVIAAAVAAGKGRKDSLEGFQSQDSTAFQLSVRAALEEAIDLAGISKALIQELPKEDSVERRVI